MTLSAEQRAEISRSNSKKSTGPRTAEGKAKSRGNALKHGLRAGVLAMPGEDPAFATARVKEWFDYYRPQSPAARHLTTVCALATVFSDRVDAHVTADAVARSQQALDVCDDAEQERVDELLPRLGRQAGVLAQLRSFAAGCRWLIGEWEGVEAALAAPGVVDLEPFDDALALLEVAPMREFGMLARALDPTAPSHPRTPDPATARARLGAIVASELSGLRAAARLAEAGDPDPAPPASYVIPTDDATARLFLRYQSEARSGFLRSWKALAAVLKSDALEGRGEDAVEDESPNEPEPSAVVPPNEPEPSAVDPPNEPARVAEVAPKVTVAAPAVAAPVARRDRMVLDGGGRPTDLMNMRMVSRR